MVTEPSGVSQESVDYANARIDKNIEMLRRFRLEFGPDFANSEPAKHLLEDVRVFAFLTDQDADAAVRAARAVL